jgi:hypothetical protein
MFNRLFAVVVRIQVQMHSKLRLWGYTVDDVTGFGVRSGSRVFARSNEDPMNKRIEGTCTNGREHRWLLPCRRSRVRVPSSALKTPASREFCFPDWKHESKMNPKKYVDVRRLPLRSGSSNRLPTRSDAPQLARRRHARGVVRPIRPRRRRRGGTTRRSSVSRTCSRTPT